MRVTRTEIVIRPDPTRVFYRPFNVGHERTVKILGRILALSDEEVQAEYRRVMAEFSDRHLKLKKFFIKRFEQLSSSLLTDQPLSEARKCLIGSYFTQEYSLESAALFNPSMVWHPDQSGLPSGSRRFVVSLRATGEGHLSSITFRSGAIDSNHNITINEPTPYVTAPEIFPDPHYEKPLFTEKLFELGLASDFTDQVMAKVNDTFSVSELKDSIQQVLRRSRRPDNRNHIVADGIMSLAQSNYEVAYTLEERLSERIIFPSTPAEVNGIEDARFVEFHEGDGNIRYVATYTAYDGRVMLPQLLETTDFLSFKISTLNGPAVQNKGMALFPRKVNGLYAMLSRQDNENVYLMYSEYLHFWYTKQLILRPTFSWEFVQLGNCGAPIETEAGWLVLTHGVGPMRKYALGAVLLDLDDPSRVIGRLHEPLLTPNQNEREGYVPNVVYSCGAQIYRGKLVIPYAMSDYASSFALVDLNDLLDELTV